MPILGLFMPSPVGVDDGDQPVRKALELRQSHGWYWMIATTQMLAVVARLRFRLGHDDEGMAVGREVLRYLSLVQTTSRLLVKADKREMPPPRITL